MAKGLKWEQGVTPLQPIPKRLLSPTYPAPRCVQSTALCNPHGGPRRGRRGYTCVTGEATHAQRGEPPAQGHTAHNSRAGIRTRACLAPSSLPLSPGTGMPTHAQVRAPSCSHSLHSAQACRVPQAPPEAPDTGVSYSIASPQIAHRWRGLRAECSSAGGQLIA